MKERLTITINSTILYVIAFLLTTIIHEFSHAIFGVLYKSNPIIHHNYVEHFQKENLSIYKQVIIALAGPIISVLQAIFSGLVYLKSRKQNLLRLFFLWFSILGFNNFFGYLMTGSIFKQGDIGKAYLLLKLPLFLQISIALLGAGFLAVIAYKLTAPFLKFSHNSQWLATVKSRKRFSFEILILPWLVGSAIITVLYLPIIAIVSIIYPIMSGMIFIFPWQNAEKIEHLKKADSNQISKPSIVAISVLIILIVLFKLVLAPGIKLH